MKRSVVLPIHDSLFVPRVIPLLAELGRRSDIDVHVVDLREEDGPIGGGARGQGSASAAAGRTDRASHVRESVLQNVSRHLSDVLGSTRVRAVVRAGNVGDELASYAREQQAELITLGVENRDADGEQAALDFARTLVRDSGSAVFLTSVGRSGTRGTLLADLDGTEAARGQLDLALASARIAGVQELTLQAMSDPR